MKKVPRDNHEKRNLVILLVVIIVLVIAMLIYHYSTESPFQNELFFGPMDDTPVPTEPASAAK